MRTYTTTASGSSLLRDYAATRDPAAFQELASHYIDWIYSVSLRLTRNPALAEDVTQGVLLALAQKAHTLQHHPTLLPWLFRATRYAASTLLRAERRRKKHEAAAMPKTPDSPDPDWSELAPRLDDAVAQLSAPDRQLILLRFYQHHTHPQIAATHY